MRYLCVFLFFIKMSKFIDFFFCFILVFPNKYKEKIFTLNKSNTYVHVELSEIAD